MPRADRLYFAALAFEGAQHARLEFMNLQRAAQRATIPAEAWKDSDFTDAKILPLLGPPRRAVADALALAENAALKVLGDELKAHGLADWLPKGVGPTLGGRLLGRVDPLAFPNVAKLWRYCGLAGDRWRERTGGRCRGCACESFERQPHSESRPPLALKGCRNCGHAPHPAGRYHHDPKLLALLVGPMGIADQFVRHGGYYGEKYRARKLLEAPKPACEKCARRHPLSEDRGTPAARDEERAGQGSDETRAADACSLLHIDRKARRYAVKAFLADLWAEAHRRATATLPSHIDAAPGEAAE